MSIALSGCSLHDRVQSSAIDYSTVLEDFNNQGILRNIIRARDNAPLSFSDLPTIHGTFNLTAGLSAAEPFGPFRGSTTRGSISPTVSFSSAPSFDTTALNTRGFSALILQPVSPTFVASLWGSDIPRALLLRLFIDSVDFGYVEDGTHHRLTMYNDPSDPNFSTFVTLLDQAINSGLELRTFTIYQPIGPAVDLTPGKKGATEAKDALGSITSVNETTFHLDNVDGGKVQLYRTLSDQVLGCVDLSKFNAQPISLGNILLKLPGPTDHSKKRSKPGWQRRNGVTKPESGLAIEIPKDETDRFAVASQFFSNVSPAQNLASMPSASGSATTLAAPGPASPSSTPPLAPISQISSVLSDSECLTNPIMLPKSSGTTAAMESENSIRVRWRSVEGIFRYLGAILRLRAKLDRANAWSWSPPTRSADPTPQTLITINEGVRGRVTIDYRERYLSLPDETTIAPNDHGLQVIALLTRLLNEDRLAADIPVTQRLEVIP